MFTLPHASGIYKITCIPTGKFYIGSSKDIKHRWGDHRYELGRNNHKNSRLQRAWKKYGEHAFVIEVLELCDVEQLIEREQHYLDTLKPFKEQGYNLAANARLSTLGHVHSPETRAKLGANKGRVFSADVRAKVSAAGRGRIQSAETRAKRNFSTSYTCVVTSPDGVESEIRNLSKFCRENGLITSCMARVARGESKQHKGWRCRYV